MFARTNMNRKPLTPGQRFRAQVFCGDPQAVEISNVCTAHGFRIGIDSPSVAGTDIRAVAAVERIYRSNGAEHLSAVLDLIAQAWFGEKMAVDRHMLVGVSIFLQRHADKLSEEHIERLKRVSSLSIVRRGQESTISGNWSVAYFGVADELRRITGLRGLRSDKGKKRKATSEASELAFA